MQQDLKMLTTTQKKLCNLQNKSSHTPNLDTQHLEMLLHVETWKFHINNLTRK